MEAPSDKTDPPLGMDCMRQGHADGPPPSRCCGAVRPSLSRLQRRTLTRKVKKIRWHQSNGGTIQNDRTESLMETSTYLPLSLELRVYHPWCVVGSSLRLIAANLSNAALNVSSDSPRRIQVLFHFLVLFGVMEFFAIPSVFKDQWHWGNLLERLESRWEL